MINFGRDVCGDPRIAFEKEWLITNGIGGYAMGTIGGSLTRRYHGLLIAALKPPVGRSLLVSKVEETVEYDGKRYPLFCNQRSDGDYSDAEGCRYLEGVSSWNNAMGWGYRLADAVLTKNLWMRRDANTAYLDYGVTMRHAPMTLSIDVWVNHRDHHGDSHKDDLTYELELISTGIRVTPSNGSPFYVCSDRAVFTPDPAWMTGIYRIEEDRRGFDPVEDHYRIGAFTVTLNDEPSFFLGFSTDANVIADRKAANDERIAYSQKAHPRNSPISAMGHGSGLIDAADQFIVKRKLPEGDEGYTIIAGYPWFSDWGRDTMIALPGLTLATGRPEIARSILETFARYVDQGMLPNTFPEAGESVMYNTVDATLWYFEAIRAYFVETRDESLIRELFPVLENIIYWHLKGTRYNIHVDPSDTLLYAGEEGVQLTWMDVKIGDWVVTPRTGKAVEINGLWHNALMSMAKFAHVLGKPADQYHTMAEKVRASFARFWCAETGYLYDVIDTPEGVDDASIRPNAVIAAALHFSPVTMPQKHAIFDVAARKLYTTHGLRSLAPDDPRYVGVFEGDPVKRDSSYHQGTVWGWLIGVFAELADAIGDPLALTYLHGMSAQYTGKCIGTLSEIFDGDPPHAPKGANAQAWTVAEHLRVLLKLWKKDF